jgi:selenocysteine-specific elongation factor
MSQSPPPRPLIVGTAGHIDHGKTALIKLLTGIETDRLKQEKERGISIELGFASLSLPSGMRLGVVDVPGHERFIKNMLAGVGGIDLILFVVAADEGVMPQTREHMDIVDLLGVARGVIALTKIDMVEADFAEIVEETVQEYIAETCLRGAPIVRVSATTGSGKENVLAALDEVAAGIEAGERGHLRRLPIDRVFTMEGFGTVVTGTLWSGHVTEGETVRIVPRGLQTRIRGLEVHNERVGKATAGQRVAVSLHAVEKSAIRRGDWLLAGEGPEPTTLVDTRLRALRSAGKPLENGARVRFHLGAAEILGRLILLEADELVPGEAGWAQLRLEEPILTERGDRFVLRSYSPMHTVAGGLVVTAGVGRRRRFRKEDLEALRQAERGTPADRVRAVLRRRGARGADAAALAKESGCTGAEVAAAVAELIDASQARAVSKGLIASQEGFADAAARLRGILEGYQRGNPISWGILKSELKQRVEAAIHADLVDAWVQEETGSGRLFVRSDRLRYGSATLELPPEHEDLRKRMLDTIQDAAFAGRKQKEVFEEVQRQVVARPGDEALTARLREKPAEQLKKEIEALLLLLVESGEVTRIPPFFYFSTRLLDEAVARVRAFFDTHEEMRVGDLKDLIGVSRKQAVPLLEYLDQVRITRRSGDIRLPGPRLRADAREAAP